MADTDVGDGESKIKVTVKTTREHKVLDIAADEPIVDVYILLNNFFFKMLRHTPCFLRFHNEYNFIC